MGGGVCGGGAIRAVENIQANITIQPQKALFSLPISDELCRTLTCVFVPFPSVICICDEQPMHGRFLADKDFGEG